VKKITVAIVGNPNVGKSVMFNNLTGTYVTVSNYPGTTVEVSRGRGKIGEDELNVIAQELEKVVANGKTFTVKTVGKIIVEKKLANYENCKNPEQALRTAGRKALISLGVIKTKS